MNELYRSENLVVRSVPAADTTRWVVTFDNYGLGPGFDRLGFGEAFLKHAGVSAIHVLGRGDDWYQYPDTLAAMAAVRRAVEGAERVVTYGSSMGGYAALRLADEAGAHAVLAISPQYSIDPVRVPFETRWQADARRLKFRAEVEGRMTRNTRPLIIYDAADDDRRHVDLIAQELPVDRLGLRNIHHPATTFLQEKSLLAPMVLAIAKGPIDIDELYAHARTARRSSATSLSLLADRQPPHRPRTALRLAQRAVEIAPNNALALSSLATRLSGSGDHEAAISTQEAALAAGNRAPAHVVIYSHILAAAGRFDEAIEAAAEAAEGLPAAAHLHYWHGSLLMAAGRTDDAIAAFERSVRLDPQNMPYRSTLIRTRRGRSPIWRLIRKVRSWILQRFSPQAG